MDKFAEKLARWFGSAPFIGLHLAWFLLWIVLHYLINFDPEWSTLTLIVSLEAIFLSLFILRAETIQSDRFEDKVDGDLRTSNIILHRLSGLKAARTREKENNKRASRII